EQRFGVEDKEKIKLLKKNVDVLTMTATPIPRTLHMGLTGIRDISVIETPPSSRLPVQTFVMEYSETLLRDAIVRELGRGGQAFVLYNRVESIDAFSASVMRIVPEAKIVVAHGQMKEDALERAVMRFYSGECNVLVSTTIIENGIDIPNANTLFVVDSDRLGLSQLHQLRGRVGRSNRLAHVYFTYAEGKILSENAYKRLNSIVEFSEFGSGFKLAMRDLEIRGAGNVLGREQHGHMERVGYDMYVKLLKESVAEVRGEELAVRAKVQTDIDIDAYLPDDYVVEEAERIRLYRRIASLADRTEADEILADLRDVYGNVPPCVHNLIKISLARVYAAELRAETVTVKAQGAFIRFEDNGILKNQALIERVSRFADRCAFSFADKPMLVFQSRSIGTQKAFEGIFAFLEG
ncbi:MAG: transcription-repair coupling factor, partial [Clostridia bacterium]|nr:transcription-repair coupling factor [Clostridia bacterium]